MLGRPFYAFVDSDYNTGGRTGDFNYTIDLPSSHDFDSVVLLQGSFPKSYYVVRSGHNSFTLTEGVSSATITLTAGNYTMAAFRTALQAALIANSPSGYTYAVTMPSFNLAVNTGKLTYGVTGNGGTQPSFFFPTSSLLYHQMGFDYNSTNTFAASSLISTNVCNFNTVRGLIVKADCVEGEGVSTPIGSNVLQEILSFNTYDFSNIGFANPAAEYSAKRLKKGTGKTFNFKITDLDDNVLEFNGQSCNFTLAFFKRDNYNELAARDLKMKYYQDLLQSRQLSSAATPVAQPEQKTINSKRKRIIFYLEK